MVATSLLRHSSISLLAIAQIVFLTFFTTAQCDVGCPVLVPSVCLQVTCQNLTRSGAVDCLSPGAFIPQGTIATYRCIPHRGKDDMNRTYTMMCICDGKWMGIDRYVRFRDWCASNIDTGPFVEELNSSYLPPQDLQLSSTSESGRLLGGETTNPSVPVPTTTMKFLEAVSTGQPLTTGGGSGTGSTELPTSTMQPGTTGAGTGTGTETTTTGPAVPVTGANTTGSETGTTTMLPETGTGSTPSSDSAGRSEATTLSPTTAAAATGEDDGNTGSTTGTATYTPVFSGTGSTPLAPASNETATASVLPSGTESTTPTPGSTNTAAGAQTTGTGQGQGMSTPSFEELTTISPSASGNVSSENMLQGKNNSREDGGRSLFSGNTTDSETTPSSGDTPTTAALTGLPTGTTGAGAGSETATPTTVTGTGAAGTTSFPATATTPTPGGTDEATGTTIANFVTTTHEPMTLATGEPGSGTGEPGTTALPIMVTTTIASLTTTVAPGTETESPVAPPGPPAPENLQNSGNGTGVLNNATGTGSAPSPPRDEDCGDDHPHESEANYTDFQLIGLQLHNTYRRMHNVSDVKLNQTLNEKAQAWAEHELTERTLQVTPGKRNYAENLYKVSGWRAITPVRAVQEAMKTWYSSVARYNWTEPNPTGFSQIVWGKTSDIGVGVAKKDDVTVVAVTYWPRGNIILVSSNANQTVDAGKLFRENVFPKLSEAELTPLP